MKLKGNIDKFGVAWKFNQRLQSFSLGFRLDYSRE